MRHKLFELNSFDDINVEGANGNRLGRSRMLPIIRALAKAFGQTKTISLGSPRTQMESYKKFLLAGRNLPAPFDRASGRFQRSLDILDINSVNDFVKFLADAQYNEILMNAPELKGISVKFDAETRRVRRGGQLSNRLSEFCEWTFDEDEALNNAIEEEIWVVRTNLYPDVPALFIYPRNDEDKDNFDFMISHYSHKLASLYSYEIRNEVGKGKGYWLARPCRYEWFLAHPMPDGSEMDDVNSIDDDLSLAESYR